MELALGTEPTSSYLSYELALGARKIVEDVMLAQKGESVVITADTAADWRVVEATAQAAYAAGAHPVVVRYESGVGSVIEPPASVAGAVARADVWIEYAVGYALYTQAFQEAIDAGCRYIALAGMDVDMMVRTIVRVDYPGTIELSQVLGGLIAAADEVHITSEAGTDIRAELGNRKIRYSGKVADTPGDVVTLGGQISWCPIEESINGTLVFDGAIWPPADIGPVRTPVKLALENGAVTRIEGGAEAAIYRRWFESFRNPDIYRLAHYSLGFNPGVTRIIGRIVEDERVFGCMCFGFGTQASHLGGKGWDAGAHSDGVVLFPSLYIDGEALEENGRYVHPDVVEVCRRISAPGY